MKTFPASLFCRALILAGTAALLPVSYSRAEDVKFTLKSSGIGTNLGYYMPEQAVLSAEKPAGLKSAPAGLESPLYGEIKLGATNSPVAFYIILDEPDGKPSRLFVDTDGKGDFAGGEAKDWKPRPAKPNSDGKIFTMYMGGGDFKVPYGTVTDTELGTLRLNFYRFDKGEKFADRIFYYRDYASAGALTLSGKSYQALIVDETATGDFRGASSRLLVDINSDGKFDSRAEAFEIGKPFNVGGTTYEITGLNASGTSFQLVKSTQTVEETKPKVSLAAGKAALPFSVKTMTGKTVNFPEDYKGKVVLLDFWATWCGPCKAEIPNVVATYEKFHDKGLEILSVSLDHENAADTVSKYASEHHMDWPQIYDGKYGKAEVAVKYYIDSIPHAFLVDGTTGKIIVEGGKARGESLPGEVEKALAARTN